MSDIIAIQTNKENMPITTQKAVEILNSAPTFEELDQSSQKSVIQIAMVDNLKKGLQFKAKIAKGSRTSWEFRPRLKKEDIFKNKLSSLTAFFFVLK